MAVKPDTTAEKSSSLLTRASDARIWWAGSALLSFVLCTAVAILQPARHPARLTAQTSWAEWFFRPVERNPPLHTLDSDLNAVFAVDEYNVWAVGNRGAIIHSADGGRTWEWQTIRPATPSPTPTSTPAPTPTTNTTTIGNTNTATTGSTNTNAGNTFGPNANRATNTNAGDNMNGSPAGSRNSTRPNSNRPAPASNSRNGDEEEFAHAPARAAQGASVPQRQGTPPTNQTRPTPARQQPPPSNTSPQQTTANQNAGPAPKATLFDTISPAQTPVLSQTPTPDGAFRGDLVAVIFRNEQRGWVVARDGPTVFNTTDGGATWQRGPGSGEGEASKTEYFINGDGVVRTLTDSGVLDTYGVAFSLDLWGVVHDADYKNFAITGQGIRVGAGGRIHTGNADGYKDWASGTTADLRAVFALRARSGFCWIVGDGGTILHSTDGGSIWGPQRSGTTARLNGVYFLDDKQHGWVVGDDGIVLGTADGGASWVRLMRGKDSYQAGAYSRSWPPWYYASWLVVGLLLVPAVRRRREAEPKAEESVADVLVSDRPLELGDPDPLEFRSLALGLSRFLRNERTVPPLTLAITGEWGTGKSSLMNLLRADLRGWKFRPVWFNAWHHQKEEHLLASLLQNIRLQAVPRWWTPRGVGFRARLLYLRGARHWLPVLLVLFFSVALLTYAYTHWGDLHASLESLRHTAAALFKSDEGAQAAKQGGESQRSSAPLLALVVSLASLAVTIWKGVTAFGVNPASLLASTSGLRLRDLDAQTSFRQRFAAEFADVTRALGVRNMIIFIDDLDRCRPENVLEVLEAVNFLVTSGDCFVVLGMARERVERSVGNSFKDVAEAALADAGVDAKEGAAEADDKTLAGRVEAVRRQTEFARQYLDKLINIEVPVPLPTPDQARELLAPARAEAPHDSRGRQRLKSLGERFGLLLAALAVLLLGWLWGSGRLGAMLRPAATPPPPPVTATPTPAPTAAPTPAPTATPSDATPTPAPTPDEDAARKATQTPELLQPTTARRSLTDYWALALFVALAVTACAWLLSRQPDLVVKDSKEFEDALRIWHPVIYSKLRTPRSIKRFMNRVRFLAMRQRRQTERKSYWSQLAAAAKRLFGIEPEETVEPAPEEKIPESILVALAATQQFDANWIANEPMFLSVTCGLHHADERITKGYQQFSSHEMAIELHLDTFNDGFGDPARMKKYRETFLKLSAGVRVN